MTFLLKVVIFRFHVNFQGCNEGRLDIIDLYLLKVIFFYGFYHCKSPFFTTIWEKIRSIFPSIEESQFQVHQLGRGKSKMFL